MSSPREIRALMFELVADRFSALIVRLDDPPKATYLQNQQRTWLTARAGDVVVFCGQMEIIEAVSLYRVHPVDQNDRYITSGAAWNLGPTVTGRTRF